MKAGRRLLVLATALPLGSLHADSGSTAELAVESFRATDIALARAAASTRFTSGHSELTLTAARSALRLDYQPAPFDFRGQALTRREGNTALRLAGQHRVAGGAATAHASLGGYRGHASYRSAWLDEYYRQQYAALAGAPGLGSYRTASPGGHDASLGARWEYVRASAFAQLTAGYAQDRVAPGYEIDFDGLRRGSDTLATGSASLALENVLARRVRSRLEVRAADTSGRARRLGGEAEVRAALGEAWIVRAHLGGARERPTFTSRFGGLALERALAAGLSGYLEGRLYRDTGEIENALLFTNAAPALRSRSLGFGLRRDGDHWSWRVAATRLFTDHAPTNPNTDFFRNLYRDRRWLSLQAALSARF